MSFLMGFPGGVMTFVTIDELITVAYEYRSENSIVI
jgi:zinc transporter ZupT